MTKRLSWAVRIERAEKRGKFNQQDKDLARGWTFCAVGERHGFIPEDDWWNWGRKSETEQQEITLGNAFADAVCEANNIPEAKRIYTEIQALP